MVVCRSKEQQNWTNCSVVLVCPCACLFHGCQLCCSRISELRPEPCPWARQPPWPWARQPPWPSARPWPSPSARQPPSPSARPSLSFLLTFPLAFLAGSPCPALTRYQLIVAAYRHHSRTNLQGESLKALQTRPFENRVMASPMDIIRSIIMRTKWAPAKRDRRTWKPVDARDRGTAVAERQVAA